MTGTGSTGRSAAAACAVTPARAAANASPCWPSQFTSILPKGHPAPERR